jgi:hypothetical protein
MASLESWAVLASRGGIIRGPSRVQINVGTVKRNARSHIRCKRGDNSKKDPDMTNLRNCGLVVAAATLLLASMA